MARLVKPKKYGKALWVLVREKLDRGKAKPPLKMRRWLPAMSKKRRSECAKYGPRRRRFLVMFPACDARVLPGCRKRSEDVHHTRGRAGPLLLDERFWMPVCRHCHDWIRANVPEARARGFLCQEGQWNVPVPPCNETTQT